MLKQYRPIRFHKFWPSLNEFPMSIGKPPRMFGASLHGAPASPASDGYCPKSWLADFEVLWGMRVLGTFECFRSRDLA